MPTQDRPPYLRLVKAEKPATVANNVRRAKVQPECFPAKSTSLVVFVDMSSISGGRFSRLLREVSPSWVIDLRLVPRFDLDGLSRTAVFSLFGKTGAQYRDVAGLLGIEDQRDARLNPQVLANTLPAIVTAGSDSDQTRTMRGPLFILLEDANDASDFVRSLPQALKPPTKRGWKVYVA